MGKVIGHTRSTDWPKLGPSLLIATVLIVAIRTAKRLTTTPPDARCADIDPELDQEISFAIRIAYRTLLALLHRHESLFPQAQQPIYDGSAEDEDITK